MSSHIGVKEFQKSDGSWHEIAIYEPGTFDVEPVEVQLSTGAWGVPFLLSPADADTPFEVQKSDGSWLGINSVGILTVDDWEHASRDPYWIQYTDQTYPTATTTFNYEGSYGWEHDSVANYAVSLPSDHPNYDSTKQSATLDTYLRTGEIGEFYFKPSTFGSNGLIRFVYCPADYAETQSQRDHYRILMDGDGYWALEEVVDGTGSVMQASDGSFAEDTPSFSTGDWHRIVLDLENFPTHEAHIWNDATGTYLSGLEAENSTYDYGGFGTWANDNTHCGFDAFDLITAVGYSASSY